MSFLYREKVALGLVLGLMVAVAARGEVMTRGHDEAGIYPGGAGASRAASGAITGTTSPDVDAAAGQGGLAREFSTVVGGTHEVIFDLSRRRMAGEPVREIHLDPAGKPMVSVFGPARNVAQRRNGGGAGRRWMCRSWRRKRRIRRLNCWRVIPRCPSHAPRWIAWRFT